MHGSLADLARFARELLRPTLVSAATLDGATTVAFPGLAGVLPGLGRYEPLDWGLGFELRDAKQPHWTGTTNSPETFGHFGASGTFLWIDPAAGISLTCLSDRPFGPWALDAWPAVSDAVLAAVGAAALARVRLRAKRRGGGEAGAAASRRGRVFGVDVPPGKESGRG